MDSLLITLDRALRTVFASHHAARRNPASALSAPQTTMSEADRREAAALMRVNHVGEVCAQALYTAQALATRDAHLRQHLLAASAEETDHWRGPKSACVNSMTAPACSIRFGTPARSPLAWPQANSAATR